MKKIFQAYVSFAFYLTVSRAVDGFAKSFLTLNLFPAVLSFLVSLKYSSLRLVGCLVFSYPKLLIKLVVLVEFIFLGLSSSRIF
jgi:hypothetical protein